MNLTEPMGLERAKLYLAGRIRTRTPLGAAEFLDVAFNNREAYDKRSAVALNCMEIYRSIFPEEWEHSTSPYLSTQREQELYRLVDDQLFPLLLSESADIETHIRREPLFFLPFIPMRGGQAHIWQEGQFDFWGVETAFQIALIFARMAGGYWPPLCERYGVEQNPAPAPPLAAVGWSLFVYSCNVEQSPLRNLPGAFHFVTYKTGCPWLDLPNVGFFGFNWSIEKVAELTAARIEAEQLADQVSELSAWLDEDPPARIARAVALWNDAAAKEREAGGVDLIHDDETGELYRRENWF